MANPTIVDLIKSTIGERTRLVRWLRVNASARRGLPTACDEDLPFPEIKVVHENAPSSTPQSTTPVVPTVPSTGLPMWAKALLTAGGLALTGGGGAGLTYLLTRPVAPVDKPVVPEGKPDSGSILQYLQDEGYHLGATQ